MNTEIKEQVLEQTFGMASQLGNLQCDLESVEAIATQLGWIREDLTEAIGDTAKVVSFVCQWKTQITLMADLLPRLVKDMEEEREKMEGLYRNINKIVEDRPADE